MRLLSIRLSQSVRIEEKETAYISVSDKISLEDTGKGYVLVRQANSSKMYAIPYSNIGHMVFTDEPQEEQKPKPNRTSSRASK